MTTQPMFEFDRSDRETLIVCYACNGVWRAFAWTPAEAEQAAIAHARRAHPGERDNATEAIRRRATRRARKTGNSGEMSYIR